MPTIAHYEVYTLEETGWVLHARFMNSEKTRALEEAYALETHLGRPTKVMRESYDPDSNRYEEQTIFLSPKALALRRRERERRKVAGPGADAGLGNPDWGHPNSASGPTRSGLRPNTRIPMGLDRFSGNQKVGEIGRTRFGAPSHARSTGDLVARVLFVMVTSLVIGTAGAALILMGINLLRNFGVVIDSRNLPMSAFSVFMVLFLVSAFWLTLRMVPLQGVLGPEERRRRSGDSRPEDAPDKQTNGNARTGDIARASSDGAAEDIADRKKQENEIEKKDNNKEDKQSEKEIKNKEKDEAKKREEKEKEQKEKEKKQKKEEKKNKKETDEDENADVKADADDLPPPTPAFESAHTKTMVFLNAYVMALKQLRPKLDPYNRFGINLFLAGVCEAMANATGLNAADFQRLLRETVEVMGTRAGQAVSFVKQLEAYLAEDRYAQMVRCGREAMTLHLSGADNAFATLGMVMADWNTPKTQTFTGSTIAIVFTDMVGSTDLTSEHGDVKAQQILRAHNAAVRSALARFNGREVKHTGDGIMATFEHVPDAVWGMIDVLRAVRAHNQAEPEIPLRIRIGINAGEPISAENDYYGLAVTVAARVCAKANMDEIIVTQIVHDMCDGTKLTFTERETTLLKGIKDPQRLYEAIWEGAPSQQRRSSGSGSSEDAGTDADPGSIKAPSQPGAGERRSAGATIDLDADGWEDPRVDGDIGTAATARPDGSTTSMTTAAKSTAAGMAPLPEGLTSVEGLTALDRAGERIRDRVSDAKQPSGPAPIADAHRTTEPSMPPPTPSSTGRSPSVSPPISPDAAAPSRPATKSSPARPAIPQLSPSRRAGPTPQT